MYVLSTIILTSCTTLAQLAATATAAPAPWWSEQASAYIGAIGGSGVGILGGIVGILMGVLAPRGRARMLVLGIQNVLIATGLLLLAAAAWAGLQSQPFHVVLPLALGGSILTCVLSGLAPLTLTIYRLVAARRVDMPGEAIGPRIIAANINGQSLSGEGARVFAALWGQRGWLRRLSNGVAALAALTGLGAVSIGLLQLQSAPIAVSVVWVVLGTIAVVNSAVMFFLSRRMHHCASAADDASQKQRLAAAEFRRG